MLSLPRASFFALACLGVSGLARAALAQPAPSASASGTGAPVAPAPTATSPATALPPSSAQPPAAGPGAPGQTAAQPPAVQPPAAQPTAAQPTPYPQAAGPWQGPPAPGQAPQQWGPTGQPQPYGPPPYGAQPPYGGYYPGYGPPPPQGPPPLPPEEPDQYRFALRFDPFDLIFRKLSFQAELAVWGPFSIEAEPSWIFASATENLDITGGSLAGNILVYFTGNALKGFFVKATVGFEKFDATLTDPELQKTATATLASPLLGVGIGSSTVFGDDFGFNLSGGVGIGFLTAETKTLTAGRYEVSFYDKAGAIQLLASLGLGVAF